MLFWKQLMHKSCILIITVMTKEINVSDTCEFLQHNQSSTADCGHGKTVTVFYPHARHTSKENPPTPLK